MSPMFCKRCFECSKPLRFQSSQSIQVIFLFLNFILQIKWFMNYWRKICYTYWAKHWFLLILKIIRMTKKKLYISADIVNVPSITSSTCVKLIRAQLKFLLFIHFMLQFSVLISFNFTSLLSYPGCNYFITLINVYYVKLLYFLS